MSSTVAPDGSDTTRKARFAESRWMQAGSMARGPCSHSRRPGCAPRVSPAHVALAAAAIYNTRLGVSTVPWNSYYIKHHARPEPTERTDLPAAAPCDDLSADVLVVSVQGPPGGGAREQKSMAPEVAASCAVPSHRAGARRVRGVWGRRRPRRYQPIASSGRSGRDAALAR